VENNIQFLSSCLTDGNFCPRPHPQSFCTTIVRQVSFRGKPYTWLNGRSASAFLAVLNLHQSFSGF
jgi:hypothetical protein